MNGKKIGGCNPQCNDTLNITTNATKNNSTKSNSTITGTQLNLPKLTNLGITLRLTDPTTLTHFVDSGIKLSVNSSKGFSLEENPSTGYSWQVNEALFNGIFEIQKDSGNAKSAIASLNSALPTKVGSGNALGKTETPHPIVGAPQGKTFILKGLKPGTATFEIAYARPWEFKSWKTVSADIEHYKFTVTVQ